MLQTHTPMLPNRLIIKLYINLGQTYVQSFDMQVPQNLKIEYGRHIDKFHEQFYFEHKQH